MTMFARVCSSCTLSDYKLTAFSPGLKKLNDWPTYPQLIVKGEFVGGLDIVQEMIDNGEFQQTLH